VVNRHIRNDWLWDRVRVLGGAYGCFSGIDLKTNVMSFVSYRDPNVKETFEVYENTGKFLRETALSGDALEQCIIGMMGDLDPCQLPDAKGYSSMLRHLNGLSDERRQQIRDEVLSTRTEDFHAFAEVLEAGRGKGHYAVLGSDDLLEGARGAFPGAVQVTPVL
jgi:Zn-dependent M16 (insulinase) family peptidase